MLMTEANVISLSSRTKCVCHFMLQANLGLLKVLVVKSQAEWLQMHLQSMVEGLLKWQTNTKNHFKAKVAVFGYFMLFFWKNK